MKEHRKVVSNLLQPRYKPKSRVVLIKWKKREKMIRIVRKTNSVNKTN